MTVNDIYQKSKIWMFEKPSSTTYNSYIIEIVNKVLVEIYEDNNMCRMFHDMLPLTSIPQVTSLSDELGTGVGGKGIMDEYLLDVLPKGIDANFMIDDDVNKMATYRTEYENSLVKKQKLVSQEKIERLTELANAS